MSTSKATTDSPDLPHEDKVSKRDAPDGAPYPVEYIMNVRLENNLGSDIPLVNRRIRDTANHNRQELPQYENVPNENRFNMDKEDYWLFSVHLHDAEMEFVIGGENPVYATSHPNWQIASDTKEKRITHEYISGPDGSSMHIYSDFCLEWNRYVAIRAPKMSNPAISVRGRGTCAALFWTGLFVKNGHDDRNEFIAVKTNARLLHKYCQRNQHESWYDETNGVDLTNDRTITLFPKQLYGTGGIDQKTYDKFITEDPANKLGKRHFAMVEEKVDVPSLSHATNLTKKGLSYTWNSERTTLIKGVRKLGFSAVTNYFNYSTGHAVADNPINGWSFLLGILQTLARVVSCVVSGDVAGLIENVIKLPDLIAEKEPDTIGFITALIEAAKAAKDKTKKEELDKVNTDGVITLENKATNVSRDFGYE